MNIEKLKYYVDEWYKNILLFPLDELESQIGMSIKDLVMQVLIEQYNHYKDSMPYISVNADTCSEYIIKPQDGYYTLEDFLINRLLRNISDIRYTYSVKQESGYSPGSGGIDIDASRIEEKLTDINQKRKLVAHEILHALKTQFLGNNISNSEKYFQLKECLKKQRGNEINDFTLSEETLYNHFYTHCGLTYKEEFWRNLGIQGKYLNTENLDEIFNELEAIRASKDTNKNVVKLIDDVFVVLRNHESSNAYITNYAYIIERLVDNTTLFVGMYLDPQVMFNKINSLYNKVFQKQYSSDKTAIEIILEQLDYIKLNPKDINAHAKLLNTFYFCINEKYILCGYNDEMRDRNIGCLGNNGLLERGNGTIMPHNSLNYIQEYEIAREHTKNDLVGKFIYGVNKVIC